MGNQIQIVKDIQDEIDKLILKLKKANEEILKSSKSANETSNSFAKIKTPSQLNEFLEKLSQTERALEVSVEEREKAEKRLLTAMAKKKQATDLANQALIKERYETQQQNKLIKEASVLSSRYSTLLQKSTTIRNQLARTIQDLNLKKKLGIDLSNKEQKELTESTAKFKVYEAAIKSAKASVDRFQENVGKYPKTLDSIKEFTKGLILSFGVLGGLRLAFDFATEAVALAREAKGVEFAFKRLGIEGVEAFDKIKKSTRGALSDLDIKKSLNEFDNFNISLEQTDVLFEFLAVRAKQTGRSVDSLRDSLVEGLSKESKLRIDNLGISWSDLNAELEKSPDFVSAVASIAKKEIAEAGDILDEATGSQEKFNASFENFKVSAGSGFIGDLTNDIYALGESFFSITSSVNSASDGTLSFLNNILRYAKGQGALVNLEATLKKEIEKRKPIIKQIIDIQKEQGVIEAQLSLNKEKYIKTNTNELISLLKSLQVKKEDNEVAKESVAYLRDKITKLKAEQEQLTINDKSKSQSIKTEIKQTEDLIKAILLQEESEGKRNKAVALSTELEKERIKELKVANEVLKTLKEHFKDDESFDLVSIPQEDLDKLQEAIYKFEAIKTAQEGIKNEIQNSWSDLFSTIEDITGVSADNISNLFDKIKDAGTGSFDSIADVAKASISVISEASASIYENKIDSYDRDIEANNNYYDTLIEKETTTDAEIEALEKDRELKNAELEEKKQKEQVKAFNFNKALSVAEIAINLAQTLSAISLHAASLGVAGIGWFAANAPIAIGLAGVQTALVLSQQPPAFAEGGVMDHDGAMLINDHKSGRLEVVERDGKLLMTTKKNALVEGKKGDIIHKDANEYFKNKTDSELIENIKIHSFNASLINQMSALHKVENLKVIDSYKQHSDNIVKAIKSKKQNFIIKNNISLKKELEYIKRSNSFNV